MTTLPNTNPTGYVFLDVDGIINPFDRQLDIDGWKLHPVEGYQVWVGKPLKPWFRQLVQKGIQFVWATTWINTAPGLRKLEKLWGLPANLPAIDEMEWAPGLDYRTSCGKRPGIIRYLNANHIDPFKVPCAWVDDHLGQLDLRLGRGPWRQGRQSSLRSRPGRPGADRPHRRRPLPPGGGDGMSGGSNLIVLHVSDNVSDEQCNHIAKEIRRTKPGLYVGVLRDNERCLYDGDGDRPDVIVEQVEMDKLDERCAELGVTHRPGGGFGQGKTMRART